MFVRRFFQSADANADLRSLNATIDLLTSIRCLFPEQVERVLKVHILFIIHIYSYFFFLSDIHVSRHRHRVCCMSCIQPLCVLDCVAKESLPPGLFCFVLFLKWFFLKILIFRIGLGWLRMIWWRRDFKRCSIKLHLKHYFFKKYIFISISIVW